MDRRRATGREGSVRRSADWLLYDLDSMRQADLWTAWRTARTSRGTQDRVPWRQSLREQVRVALLFGGRLVLPDTQVFDGTLLLLLGPDGLREMTGPVPTGRVQVALRAGSATESLDSMLNGRFESSAERALAGDFTRAQIQEMRMRWVQALSDGRFDVTRYPTTPTEFRSCLAAQLADTPPPSEDQPAVAALRSHADRSSALAHLRREAAHPDSAALRAWWNAAYMDALAVSYRATWLRTTDAGLAPAVGGETEPAHRVRELGEVTTWYAESLGELTPGRFAELLSEVSAGQTTQGWLVRLRRRLATVAATAPTLPVIEALAAPGRIVAWAVLLAWAVGAEVDAWASTLARIPDSAAIAIVAIGALLQIPYADTGTLFRSLRRVAFGYRRGLDNGRE